MDLGFASGCTWSTARGNTPSPGQPTPGVVKQDKSSGGSVDTTKTRSGPQRVRMSGGERPIGAAKGKQSDTEALCQTTPHHHQNGRCSPDPTRGPTGWPGGDPRTCQSGALGTSATRGSGTVSVCVGLGEDAGARFRPPNETHQRLWRRTASVSRACVWGGRRGGGAPGMHEHASA